MVNVNGRLSDGAHAVVSVFDHGFLYGEGIYETLRTYNGQPFLIDRHLRRLRNSARMIALDIPLGEATIAERFEETMSAAGLGRDGREAYLRILVTRGVGELSYEPDACQAPTVVVIAKPHVELASDVYDRGVMVALVPIVRNHPGSVNPLIKSNNLLNNALAMQDASRRGGFEGVMRNYRGELAECTTSNLFIVRGGIVLTPPLDAGLLAGITREFLFEVAADADVTMREAVLRDEDLLGADEAFLTSTTREVVPIVRVDEARIGSGMPGPITRLLLERYRERAQRMTGAKALRV
jgi:branched-chain amino acid aminotransferase